MVCSYCNASIFNGCEEWDIHRVLGSRPLPSDIDACGICSRLCEDVRTRLDQRQIPSDARLYWWRIKRSGRIREAPEVFSITFRPNTRDCPVSQGLPQRTFFLLERGAISVADRLSEWTESEDSIQQIRTWIDDCENTHSVQCRVPPKPYWVPKRLIKTGKKEGDRIVIVDTTDPRFEKSRYATLSHCWGDPNKSKLEPLLRVENISKFMDPAIGIDWDELPRNFQHAIQITRQIGVGYIWIDALCIVQDNGEFRTEGHFMHRVYRNSYCNLAAVASDNCHGGFFCKRTTSQWLLPQVVISSKSQILPRRSWHILDSRVWVDQLLSQPLYNRGWVFQERMLSPRVLHFSTDQIFWDCATKSACEVFPTHLPPRLDTYAAIERHWRTRLLFIQGVGDDGKPLVLPYEADDSLEAFWKNAVRNYTSCLLTYATDRLKAIWGVAKLVRDQLRLDGEEHEEYGAGLWSTAVSEQLAWRVVDPTTASRPEKLREYPTWTWASLMGEIEVQDRFSYSHRLHPVTSHSGGDISFRVKPPSLGPLQNLDVDPDDYQPDLVSTRLDIRGYIVPVTIVVPSGQDAAETDSGRMSRMQRLTLHLPDEYQELVPDGNSTFEVFPDTLELFVKQNDEHKLVILAASWESDEHPDDIDQSTTPLYGTGLILQRINAESEKDSFYCRKAVCHFRGISKAAYDSLCSEKPLSNFWLI